MKLLVLGLVLLTFVATARLHAAATNEITGHLGYHQLSFRAIPVAKSASFAAPEQADYLAVTEVYPDTPKAVVYSYRLSAKGIGAYERRFKSRGFGPVTYFIRVKCGNPGPVKITNHATGPDAQPVLIASVWGVREADLKKILEWDRFAITGLVPDGKDEQRNQWIELLSKNLVPRPSDHIATGFSSEIFYCNRDKDNVKKQTDTCAQWANRYRMPAVLGFVSWRDGTPVDEPDGLGGKFGDVKYQQVCYSPDSESAENKDLKALLGDRYDSHYGLSAPDCPWPTMNSPVLNAYRCRRLSEAAGILKDIGKTNGNWIRSIFLENEPRYWDSQCEAGNPKSKRKTVEGDFNPLVIADAKKDGVDLDPGDGLSDSELTWLHGNVGRYNQDTVNAIKQSLSTLKFGASLPVYTYAPLQSAYPGSSLNHTSSEWAYATGARAGLECLSTQPSDMARPREWGNWANVNREENDGKSIDLHLWDLRVSYMMGADFYNSCNWQAIGEQCFFDYAKEFLAQYPVATLPPAQVRVIDRTTLKLKTPMKLQAFSRIDIPVKVASKIKGCAFLCVTFDDGEAYSSSQQPIDFAPGRRTLSIEFATPAECPYTKEAQLVLYVFNANGRLSLNSVAFTQDTPKSVKLSLDLRTQRALSLAVVNRSSQVSK